jgi:hypothetical protein
LREGFRAFVGWHFRTVGADMIVMFYEPMEGLVLFTFDYS